MGYYVRVFCKSETIPNLNELEKVLKKKYSGIRLETGDPKEASPWENAHIIYDENKLPIVINCNVNDSPDSLAAQECQEFIKKIGKPGLFNKKKKVINHLNNTKYTICSQFLGDIEESGYQVNDEVLKYFYNNYDGLIQADGEGFYEGVKLIVPLK